MLPPHADTSAGAPPLGKARREATRILAAAERQETLGERRERVVEQIRKRLAGEPIMGGLRAFRARSARRAALRRRLPREAAADGS